MNIQYKEKYLKYKSKYLNLQLLSDSSKKYSQTGGNNDQEKINTFINGITNIQNSLDENKIIEKNIIDKIIQLLKELKYDKNNILFLFSETNINKIIEINEDFRELYVKNNIRGLKDFLTNWYEFIELRYYSFAEIIIPKYYHYEQKNDEESAVKTAGYKKMASLFIKLYPTIESINAGFYTYAAGADEYSKLIEFLRLIEKK
jgi:hypothetical protein